MLVDDPGYVAMVGFAGIEVGEQGTGIDDLLSPKPSSSSSLRWAIASALE